MGWDESIYSPCWVAEGTGVLAYAWCFNIKGIRAGQAVDVRCKRTESFGVGLFKRHSSPRRIGDEQTKSNLGYLILSPVSHRLGLIRRQLTVYS